MYFIYIIKSVSFPEKFYVGYALDVNARIEKHNEGGSIYTRNYGPWELIVHFGFDERSKALKFEKYLKSHAGRIFMQKRLV